MLSFLVLALPVPLLLLVLLLSLVLRCLPLLLLLLRERRKREQRTQRKVDTQLRVHAFARGSPLQREVFCRNSSSSIESLLVFVARQHCRCCHLLQGHGQTCLSLCEMQRQQDTRASECSSGVQQKQQHFERGQGAAVAAAGDACVFFPLQHQQQHGSRSRHTHQQQRRYMLLRLLS